MEPELGENGEERTDTVTERGSMAWGKLDSGGEREKEEEGSRKFPGFQLSHKIEMQVAKRFGVGLGREAEMYLGTEMEVPIGCSG
jgi:hypothetical protein